ncbi:hypothetical protein D9756_007154 [Leucocoprinus leucothites]|uniref:F-box domain-containing protein n=1 Tax=Leucocoprinus leucothites TaxID=201217 RepID=A0A8H5D742_9AGAR|nr:hypothetical protein D9756_007154 [Leucoagaricus leucothites]
MSFSDRPSTLPFELVHEIVRASLDFVAVNRAPGLNTKPPWDSISSLSLTCKAIRRLVLRAWFCRLYTENPEDTTQLTRRIAQVEKAWVKYIHCVQMDRENSPCDFVTPWNFEGYCQLETVRLDWISPVTTSAGFDPFVNAPSTIVNFDLRGRYWPIPSTYSFIPRCLPFIRNLILYQQEVWCGLCFTVNEVELRKPISHRIQYDSGFGLPIHYAKVLEPLSFLDHVSIKIPVYDSGSISMSESSNYYMWSGECDSCQSLLLADRSFADGYVSRKQQGIIRLADGTEHRWKQPPSLRSVEWIFIPATADDARNLFHFGAEISGIGDNSSDSEREEDGHDVIATSSD